MRLRRALALPLSLLEVFTAAKSFVDNPVLGSRRLNEMGLHRARCAAAARMAAWRRRRIANRLDAADRKAFDANGLIVLADFLPAGEFERLRREILETSWETLEMRQGPALTRQAPLDLSGLARRAPCLSRFVQDPRVLDLIRYAASAGGRPAFSLQAILVASELPDGGADPQCLPHRDTFHACAKAWYFLHDVGPEDGPFFYVAGSHRRTPARLAWERRMSLGAAGHPDRYHARGSFRISESELAEIGLPAPAPVCVRANTLVIADTSGFHGRTPSPGSTVRVEIHASFRRSPFLPWLGFDIFDLPLIRGRLGSLRLASGRMLRGLGMKWIWPEGGRKPIDSAN